MIQIENKYLKKKSSLLDQKEESAEKIAKKAKEIEKIEKNLTDEDRWSLEYEKLKDHNIFQEAIQDMETCLYKRRGYISTSEGEISSGNMALLHTNDLISIIGEYKNQIEATNKGKYFLKKFIQEG